MSTYLPAIVWALWGGAFFLIELPAVFNKTKGDTLSENLRRLFHTNTFWGRVVWMSVFGLFSGWLSVHIAFSLL